MSLRRCPVVVERSVLLGASPEDVFAALTTPATVPLIDPGVRSWIPDSEPIRVGTCFEIRGRLAHVPYRARSRCVEWEPPSLAGFESISPKRPFTTRALHTLDAEAGGATLYRWRIELAPNALGAGPLTRFAARAFARAVEAQNSALADHLASAR